MLLLRRTIKSHLIRILSERTLEHLLGHVGHKHVADIVGKSGRSSDLVGISGGHGSAAAGDGWYLLGGEERGYSGGARGRGRARVRAASLPHSVGYLSGWFHRDWHSTADAASSATTAAVEQKELDVTLPDEPLVVGHGFFELLFASEVHLALAARTRIPASKELDVYRLQRVEELEYVAFAACEWQTAHFQAESWRTF